MVNQCHLNRKSLGENSNWKYRLQSTDNIKIATLRLLFGNYFAIGCVDFSNLSYIRRN